MKKNLILILLTIIFLLPVGLFGQSFWMDNNGLIDAGANFFKYISVWGDELLGFPSTTTYTSLFHYFFSYLSIQIFGYNFGYYAMYFVTIFSILFLGEKIVSLFYEDKYITIGLAIGLVFNLSILRFFYGQGTITILYGIIGFLITLYCILKIYLNKKVENRYLIGILLSTIFITHPFLFFFYNIILFCLIVFVLKLSFRQLFVLFILIFFINFYWIFQFIYGGSLADSMTFLKSYTDGLVAVFSKNSSLVYSATFLGKDIGYIQEFFGDFSFIVYTSVFSFWLLFFYKLFFIKSKKYFKLYITILLVLLFLFVFSVGTKPPFGFIYDYLYTNFGFFKAFRTFSNVLVFAFILFYLFLIIKLTKKQSIAVIILNLLFVFAFLGSIISMNYSKNSKIPNEYFQIKSFVDNSNIDGNVLILPCSTYDYYSWDTGKQDKYFLQAFFNHNGVVFYRPTLDGFKPLKGFLPDLCNSNINSEILKKYNIQYILNRKDLLYQDKNYYHPNTSMDYSQLELVLGSENVDLYKTNVGFQNFLKRKNSSLYDGILNFSDKINVKLLTTFNKHWKLYLEPYTQPSCQNPQIYTGMGANLGTGSLQTGSVYRVTECKGEKKNNIIEGIKKLREQPVFDDTHQLVNEYANGRTLDADYIKQNFPKEYYKENPDGSIDVNLTLYFKPQSYFYLGLGVSGLTFLGLIAWLIIEWRREKKALSQKTDEN